MTLTQPAMPLDSERQTILFLDHTASLGGGELALLALVQCLDPCTYRPIVVLSSDGPLKQRLEAVGIETYILPLAESVVKTRKDSLQGKGLLRPRAFFAIVTYVRLLARFIHEHDAVLVHTNSLKADILGGLAARLVRRPVIWHVRDRIELDYLPGPVVRGFRFLCRFLPNAILANSQSTLETLCLPDRVLSAVAYSGMEIGEDAEQEALLEPASSLSALSTPLIGIVGRLSPWKGQHIFVEAAARVSRDFPEARFEIIGSCLFGEEAYEARLRARVEELGLTSRIAFLGFRNDVPERIGAMTLCVHASTSGEPFGQVVLQAMAAGKPVVATRGGGVLELVVPEQTGLLVPMGDAEAMAEAIAFLLANPAKAREMGRKGRERARTHFTMQQTVAQVERLYGTLTHKQRP